MATLPPLSVGSTYSWDDLSQLFDFRPDYLGAAGGMVPRPTFNALLLITHPGGGKSFDYEDYWEGADLIYTGRGKRGDQTLDGPNGDVAGNRRDLLVFEHEGPRRLRFMGQAVCTQHWEATGPGDDGVERVIQRFRLSFSEITAPQRTSGAPGQRERYFQRRARTFDPAAAPGALTLHGPHTSPEETLTLQEKANQTHHELLVHLHRQLTACGWQNLEEIPAAIDLRGTSPAGTRVIFEAKTLNAVSASEQCRAALAQLLEYRFFYGSLSDGLCLVVNRPVSDARIRLLESIGIAIVCASAERLDAIGPLAAQLFSPPAASTQVQQV